MHKRISVLPIPPVLPVVAVRPILPVLPLLFVIAVAPFAHAQERMSTDSRRAPDGRAEKSRRRLQSAARDRPDRPAVVGAAARTDQIVPALQIRLHYLNRSVLAPRLTELAILTAARKWTNNWEWNAHSTAAATAGLNAGIMAALADGRRPDRMAEDEALVYDFSLELQNNQSVSDGTYAKAAEKFGEAGVVELASIQGYCTYLAMVMNVARITTQPNGASPLERYPRVGK